MEKSHLRLSGILLFFMLAACSNVEAENTPLATITLMSVSSYTPTSKSASSRTPMGTPIPAGPTPTPFVHIIQQGETLLEIAFRYGVQFDDIVLVNPQIDPNLLRIGEEIRIPGSDGEPVEILLPTPTPIPVNIKTLGCHESPSLAFICMVSITNNEEFMVAGISAHITLHDSNGQILDNQIVYAPINQIPTGQEIPLIAIFDRKPSGYSEFQVDLLSAVQVADPIDELPEIEVLDTATIYKAEKRLADVSGTLSIAAHSGDEFLVRVVGVVFGAKGDPIGMNVWEEWIDSANNEEIGYRFSVFSLGPEIAGISIYPEVMLK